MEEPKHWSTELEEKYIHLFEIFDDPDSILNGKAIRGIEVAKGWKKIVERLLERLEWIRTHNLDPAATPWEIKIFQIKQKFGELRAYATCKCPSWIERQVECAIAKAEAEASLTCEHCGRIGEPDGSAIIPTTGWISVLCEGCKFFKNKKEKI